MTLTGVALPMFPVVVRVPCPSWPWLFSPHAQTVPSVRRAYAVDDWSVIATAPLGSETAGAGGGGAELKFP